MVCAATSSARPIFDFSIPDITRPLQLNRPSSQITPASQIILKIDPDVNETGVMAAVVQRAKIQAARLQRSQTDRLAAIRSVEDVSLDTIEETWGPLMDKLAVFSNIADSVAEVRLS